MVGNSQSEFTMKIHTFIPRNSKSHFARVMYTFQAFLLFFISIFHFLIYSAILTLLYNVHLFLYFTNSTVYTYKVFNTYLKLYSRNCGNYISVCGLHSHAKEDQATNQTKKTKLTSPELHGRQ